MVFGSESIESGGYFVNCETVLTEGERAGLIVRLTSLKSSTTSDKLRPTGYYRRKLHEFGHSFRIIWDIHCKLDFYI